MNRKNRQFQKSSENVLKDLLIYKKLLQTISLSDSPSLWKGHLKPRALTAGFGNLI